MGGDLQMMGTHVRIRNLGIPNLLSILRIILIPVFIGVFFSPFGTVKIVGAGITFQPGRPIAAGILVVSCLTDILDGIIARKFDMITELGRSLDPLADKLTQAAVCVCLVIWSAKGGQIAPMFLLGLFIVKECVMIVAGANIIRKGKVMISSKWFGKLSTVVFYIVMIVIIAFPLPVRTVYILIAISLVFMIFSFIMYIPIFLKLASGESGEGKQVGN
jgi:cardiolipin synthase